MNKYAVLIGNSRFPDEKDKTKLPDLVCPEQDVDGLGKVLSSERGEFQVLPLKNRPSYEVLDKLQDTVNQAQQGDLLLIFYSGHGKPNKLGILHLTTLDTVVNKLESRAIPISRVYDILGTGKCKKIVIILDCCYSGAAGQGFKGALDDQLQQLNNVRGTYLVTSSTELQVAYESAADGNSLFTKHLIAGLETGEADKDGDGWVSMNELYDYVQSNVVAENPAQQPTKHVKEERGGLLIYKSGKDARKEPDKQTKLLLSELENQLEKQNEKNRLLLLGLQKQDEKKWQVIGKYKVKGALAIDTKTELMWLRFAHGQTWNKGTADGKAKLIDWKTAFKVANDFNNQGGYSDWRLPTINELKTLIDKVKGKKGNYIDANVFPNNDRVSVLLPEMFLGIESPPSFWSSSPENGNSGFAWVMDFRRGDVYTDYERNARVAVRLVRSEK